MLSLEDVPEPATATQVRDPLLEEKLWRLVASLPDKPRMAVILRYQEDMELREIAEVMEIPINTVKSPIERALDIIGQEVKSQLLDPVLFHLFLEAKIFQMTAKD